MKKLNVLWVSISISFSVFYTIALVSCSPKHSDQTAKTVLSLSAQKKAKPNALTLRGLGQIAVSTEVKLSRTILDTEFLYDASLQFSSLREDSLSTAVMSLVLGVSPAYFQVVGEKLQFLANQSHIYESDVNHPSRLVYEFEILRQDEASITINISQPSPVLSASLFGSVAPPIRSGWIRSLEYVQEAQMTLIESTIETADGNISEYMEAIYPRKSRVRAGFQPIFNDPNIDLMALRFRFLDPNGIIFLPAKDGRVATTLAAHWDLENLEDKGVIRWWVTPNVPDTYLPELKAGVEGWNRYSQAMWGKDFIRFEGKLPEGARVGDPRFNVIVWDHVQEAGAAYESQASDPTTGTQLHSIIYLPYAWINIGKEFWTAGQFGEKTDLVVPHKNLFVGERKFLGQTLPVHCVNDLNLKLSILAYRDPETFARKLLKNTLFHEVGHSMGLGHNFKGSLAFDPEKPGSMFSYSIMDYNRYDQEEAAFESLESSNGPLLEYDRQIISYLYNGGKDIKTTDLVIPACDDAEVMGEEGGVDPLCVDYDLGAQPGEELERTLSLVLDQDAVNYNRKSLSNALEGLNLLLSQPAEDIEKAQQRVALMANGILVISKAYLTTSANGLAYTAVASLKNYYSFLPGILPEGYHELEMRELVRRSIEKIANLDELPENVALRIDELSLQTETWLRDQTPIKDLGPNADQAVKLILEPLQKVKIKLNLILLPTLRAKVLSQLVYKPKLPFFFEVSSRGFFDFEHSALLLLQKSLLNSSGRTFAERLLYAKALVTYKPLEKGAKAIESAKESLKKEVSLAKDQKTRAGVRSLLDALRGL